MSLRRAGVPAACLAAMLLAGAARAQVPTVRIYSEFLRIDPFGKVVSADRPLRADLGPREILSPGLARNSHATYHLAITVPPGLAFTLYIGQNPDDFLGVTVYKEIYAQHGDEWIPDALEPVQLPYVGRLPDSSSPIPNQTTVTFLLDVRVPAGAEVRRTKLEAEVYVDARWIIYPMEVRILPAVIPEIKGGGGAVGAVERPSDSAVRTALRAYLCGDPPGEATSGANIRSQILRNVSQDLALARAVETSPGARLLPLILRSTGSGDAAKWCQNPVFPADLGPEWYLRIRDALYRMLD